MWNSIRTGIISFFRKVIYTKNLFTIFENEHFFADIINGLIFKGEHRVKPEELSNGNVHSQYKADDGKLHELERDATKHWKRGIVEFSVLGLENQTVVDNFMPFRIFSYDGNGYRSQLLQERPVMVPVVTIVLYFGTEHHWNAKKNLLAHMNVPEGLEEYVNDFKIHVFEIAWLSAEEVSRFESDFKVVANFFVKKRIDPNYDGRDETEIKHVDAVLKLLSAMTGDARYANLLTNPNAKKGVHNMCDVAERLENKGRAEGRTEGRTEERMANIRNMLADHVPHDKIKQYTHATDAEIAEAEEEMLVK